MGNAHWNLPNSDKVVGIASKQCLAISWPSQWYALWKFSFGIWCQHFRTQLIHLAVVFQVPNLDGWSCGNTKPVPAWTIAQCINDVLVVPNTLKLTFLQVPQVGFAILAPRRTECAIRWHSDSIDVSRVAVLSPHPTVGQIPHLYFPVPSTGDHCWVPSCGRKAYTWYPIFMLVVLLKCISGKTQQQQDAAARSLENQLGKQLDCVLALR